MPTSNLRYEVKGRKIGMAVYDSVTEQRLLLTFKVLNRFMIIMWRLGFGVWMKSRDTWGQIMVLGHRGRKTGILRKTPVNYAFIGEDLYCAAGFGKDSDWYRNVLVNPDVEVWHPDGRWKAVAEDVSDSSDRVQMIRELMIGSGVASRVAGVNPRTISDERLAMISKHYRLLRIRRMEAMTGAGGPGDLAWIWPLTTLALLWMVLRRSRRR
jgi:deazaflavin-dependent oxidoreductase (nitroreductase family)